MVRDVLKPQCVETYYTYNLSETWRGLNWVDLMAAQGAFGTDFYDKKYPPFLR